MWLTLRMELCWNLGPPEKGSGWPQSSVAMQQSRLYGATLAAMGRQVAWAEIRRSDGSPLAHALALLRPVGGVATVGLIGRGPVWQGASPMRARAAVLRSLRRSLPGPGVGVLLVTPDRPLRGLLPLMTAPTLAQLPLGEAGAMQARMHGKWRNRLRRAEDAQLRVEVSRNPDVLVALLEREIGQQQARKYRALPAGFIANWVRADPDAFAVYRAMLGTSDCVAEMLFLDHAPGVTYQIGWSSGAGRTLSAHQLLLWRAMQDYASLGRTCIDLGGLDTVNAPGLARFKLGSGARAHRLGESGLALPWAPWGRRKPFKGRGPQTLPAQKGPNSRALDSGNRL